MKLFQSKNIYLDHAAATPLDQDVVKMMHTYERELYANPSALFRGAVKARNMVEDARASIAKIIFAHPDEIIFTGSGTESDALAIFGIINEYKGKEIPHIVTTTIEHPAVLENCRRLEKEGKATVTYVNCDDNGIVDPKSIRDALIPNTILVSVMYANNEIGTIQPIMEIAKEIRHFRKANNQVFPYFHTDAAQAVNYLPMSNIEKLGIDLLSFNSSKIYGPKGVGVLYKKRGIKLTALYEGGGQEFGMRSGTENVPSILGLVQALEVASNLKDKESLRLSKIRDYAIHELLSLSKTSEYDLVLNGHASLRLPNNINISIKGISSELLVIELDACGIFVSAKSACKSDEPNESHVIASLRKAQGIETNTIDGSIRISLGRSTVKGDIDVLVTALSNILAKYKPYISSK